MPVHTQRHHSLQLMNRFSQAPFSVYGALCAPRTPLQPWFAMPFSLLSPITALATNFLNFIRKYTSAVASRWQTFLLFSIFFLPFIHSRSGFVSLDVTSFPSVASFVCLLRSFRFCCSSINSQFITFFSFLCEPFPRRSTEIAETQLFFTSFCANAGKFTSQISS